MICPRCKRSNPEGSNFCKYCKTLLQKTDEKIRCKNGHLMDKSWVVCPHCPPESREESIRKPTKPEYDLSDNNLAKDFDDNIRRKTLVENENKGFKKTIVQGYDDVKGEKSTQNEQLTRLVGFLVTYSIDPMGQFFAIREGRYKIGRAESDINIPNDHNMSS